MRTSVVKPLERGGTVAIRIRLVGECSRFALLIRYDMRMRDRRGG